MSLSFVGLKTNDVTNFRMQTKDILWHDLITPDLDASKTFYKNLFGWSFKDVNFKGLRYTTIYNDSKIVGGMIEIKTAENATWISALPLSVSELNDRIKKITVSGGRAVLAPLKLPERGKQIVFEGSQGEEFSLMSINSLTSQLDNSKQDGNWIGIELWADDPEQAKTFYESAFNVSTIKTTYDNKPYWKFKSGSNLVAGMMKNPITNQGSQWVPYVQYSDIANLVPAIKKDGGSILLAPNKDIRDGNLGIFQDQFGAIFAVQNF